MIGIGVTTCNRYNVLNLCLEQIAKHTSSPHKLFVWDDTIAQTGIAYGKNQCLYNLRECSNIFLFDDDCFPIADNWSEYFISSTFKHLVYANNYDHNLIGNCTNENDIIGKYYEGSAGCFLYYTNDIIDKVGYFNTQYKKYGFEHSAYSQRINKAHITHHPYICLENTNLYIHSLDLDGPFKGHKNSITIENDEKLSCIKHNKEIYLQEINSNKLFYPFNQQ